MLNIIVPKNRFNTTDYPNLESRADGMVIPYRYGQKAGITPVCIDTSALTYKLADHAIKEIVTITADGSALSAGAYTENLAIAEFTVLSTPPLVQNTTYYIVVEADFTISATNHLKTTLITSAGGRQAYFIDGSNVWTGQSDSLSFAIWGADEVGGYQWRRLNSAGPINGWAELRKTAATTKIAQSFTTPNYAWGNYYPIRIMIYWYMVGTTTGNMHLEIHSDQVGTKVGCDCKLTDVSILQDYGSGWGQHNWPQRSAPSEVICEIKGRKNADTTLMDNVADVLEDVAETVIGVPSGELDSTVLATLKAQRTQEINPQLDSEMTFGEFLERLESGQFFKFVPQLDGTHAPVVYQSGEPAGTPHLKDEDFLSFSMTRDLDSVRRVVKTKYDMDPTTQLYDLKEQTSKIAEYGYKSHETLEIETYLKDAADATQLATDCLALFEVPQLKAAFQLRGTCLDQIPTDKVKITRSRACYAGGALDAVLFRILSITKTKHGDVKVTALLDSQSY